MGQIIEKVSEARRSWLAANRVRINARNVQRRAQSKERFLTRERAYRLTHSDKIKDAHRKYRKVSAVKAKANARKWAKAHPHITRAQGKRHRERYKERINSRTKQWRINHPEKQAACAKAWWQANPDKVNAAIARRQAAKIHATPVWLTASDHAAMRAIYREAARLTRNGIPHHVDHVVPLRGKHVCGLHIPSNLRVVTARENMIKNNRFD